MYSKVFSLTKLLHFKMYLFSKSFTIALIVFMKGTYDCVLDICIYVDASLNYFNVHKYVYLDAFCCI